MGLLYKLKKLKVKWRRSKEKDLGLDDVQQKAYNITIRLINDKTSELMTEPYTGRRCIRNRDIFISIKKNNVCIINGIYYYDIYIDDRIYENITHKFDHKLSRKINAIEGQVKSKVKNSLDIIMNNISRD
ncbi:MAG: hypothetical protein AABY15_05625 [Nanoarchaeota archaeon]